MSISAVVSLSSVTKNLSTNFDEFFAGVGCATNNSWLDFAADLDHDADYRNFYRNLYHGK